MRKWAGRAAPVVVGLGLVFVSAPAAAAENEVSDKNGDPVDCEASDTLPDRRAGDVTSAAVFESIDDGRIVIEVIVDGVIEEILEQQFSWAVLVEKAEQDGTVRMFVLEVHDGVRKIGEINPQTSERIESDVNVDFDGSKVSFDVDQTLAATKSVRAAAFNTPVEGEGKSCDFAPTIQVKAETDETPAPAGPDKPLVDKGEDGGGGFPVILVIFGVVVVVGVVGLVAWRRRVGPTVVREVPTGDFCDWAAYWEGSTGRTTLRRAEGHECCVYTFSLVMTVNRATFAVQGRQDDPAVEGPDGRLRIPRSTLGGRGLDTWAKSSARNGPAGTLDSMQGLGDRPQLGPPDDDRPPGRTPLTDADLVGQSTVPPFDEPFDPSSSTDWEELHVLKIALNSMCPDHQHRYASEGESTVSLLPGHECTNREPGMACPVGAPAVGRASFLLEGGLMYFGEVQAGHLPQRDSDHDHPDLARQEAAERATEHDARPTDGDFLQIDVRNEIVMGAGTRVPRDVWPTTDRVTADIQSYVEHSVSVKGEMQRAGVCDTPGPCCGRECRCKPAFDLKLVDGEGQLTIDGTAWRVFLGSPPPSWAQVSAAWDVAEII